MTPLSVDVSSDGDRFVVLGSDRQVRVFGFRSGKLLRSYDESLSVYQASQKEACNALRLDNIDFGRRLALERDLDAAVQAGDVRALGSVLFDASGHFVLYPTLIGVKVVNVTTNALARVLGRVESGVRCTALALYQGRAAKERGGALAEGAATLLTGGGAAQEHDDPLLLACSHRRERFFVYSRREPTDDPPRDVFNERPKAEQSAAAAAAARAASAGARHATIHTTKGDIRVKLFLDEVRALLLLFGWFLIPMMIAITFTMRLSMILLHSRVKTEEFCCCCL